MNKRIISLVLIAIMLLSLACSCTKSGSAKKLSVDHAVADENKLPQLFMERQYALDSTNTDTDAAELEMPENG